MGDYGSKGPNCGITDKRTNDCESSKQNEQQKSNSHASRPANCPKENEPLIRCTPKEPLCPETPTQVSQQAAPVEKEVGPKKPTRVECPLKECPPRSSAVIQQAKTEIPCPKPAAIRPQGDPCPIPKAARKGLSTWAKVGLAAIALFSGFAMYNIYFRDDCEDTCTCGCKPEGSKDDEC
ncbi:uncharacterized protein [Diabrotica undecimpunctata]|uniref:uncharacterized protein n=1 Tax=Diabrotica undecimpunctata TaxID=50387 RepID=UPI003B63DBA5